jgi:hypothetical protein
MHQAWLEAVKGSIVKAREAGETVYVYILHGIQAVPDEKGLFKEKMALPLCQWWLTKIGQRLKNPSYMPIAPNEFSAYILYFDATEGWRDNFEQALPLDNYITSHARKMVHYWNMQPDAKMVRASYYEMCGKKGILFEF